MRHRLRAGLPAVVIGLVSLAAGCRVDPGIELLERELRLQEDEIYRLVAHLDEAHSQLEACRTQEGSPAQSRRDETSDELPEAKPFDDEPLEYGLPENERPDSRPPPEIEIPVIPDRANEAASDSAPRARLAAPPGTREVLAPPRRLGVPSGGFETPTYGPNDWDAAGPSDEPQTARPDVEVTGITLNRFFTGGYNADGKPGDEGVALVIEPRSAGGELVEIAGEVNIVVLDPSQQGAAARIARWDFSADETAELLEHSAVGEGIQFRLYWPSQPPEGETLKLYVRYITSDGRKLVAEKTINVETVAYRGPSAPARVESPTAAEPSRDRPSRGQTGNRRRQRRPPVDVEELPTPPSASSARRRSAGLQRPVWTPYR